MFMEVLAMPLIRFTEKEAEGFVILATHGEGRAYRGGLMTVSSALLQQVEPLFAERGVRYEILNSAQRPGSVTEKEATL